MSLTVTGEDVAAFVAAADQVTASFASAREVIRSTLTKAKTTGDFDVKDGISLLSLKNDVLLSYLQSLVLLSSHRILGHSLLERSPPSDPFNSAHRDPRGIEAGDFVDSAVEARAVLEKTKSLEARMRYQIQKLVRVAEDTVSQDQDITHDPLAFRPNLNNFVSTEVTHDSHRSRSGGDVDNDDGIYRPPKLAPVPYTDAKEKGSKRRAQVPSALASLAHLDPSMPHTESTSGLGALPSSSAARSRLDRMVEFEESNMTRLLLNKKETNRRLRDEADIALGGMGGAQGRARGGGLEDEFDDVLRGINRSKTTRGGDGYDELRQKGKKTDVLERSRTRKDRDDAGGDVVDGGGSGGRAKKRGRFEKEVKGAKRKAAGRTRR